MQQRGDIQRELLTYELESVGIRLNQDPPNIYFKQKVSGGLTITSTVPLNQIDEKLIRSILHEYRIFHAEILFKCDANVDQFIDVVEGKRVYLRCVYVYNKIDTLSIEELEELANKPYTVVCSCNLNLNLDNVVKTIWENLGLVRVYTKKTGEPPDFREPLVLRTGCTVEQICHMIHRDLVMQFKYALVWGTSVKHIPQRVGVTHTCEDEDVITVQTR